MKKLLFALFFALAPIAAQAQTYVTGAGGVTPSGTFTAGDLIVGAGTTSVQDSATLAATGALAVNGGAALTNNWANTGNFTPGEFSAGLGLAYSISTVGQTALYIATRSSDAGASAVGTTTPLFELCQSDSTTNARAVWCSYSQAEMLTGSIGDRIFGFENSVLNQLVAGVEDPYTPNPSKSSRNYRMDCGIGTGIRSPTNCTVALDILNNGAAYISGIIFGNGSLTGTNPCALCMASGYSLTWYTAASTVGGQLFYDSSSNFNLNVAGTNIVQVTSGGIASFFPGSTGSNYFQLDGGRGFYGYNSATNATSIGGGTTKGFEVRVGGTNGTFLAGTLALAISSAAVISVPAIATGTPTASLCLDASNNIIKKTTTGSCI